MATSSITAWSETALVSIVSSTGATVMTISAITETIDIDLGDKDMEGVSNLIGGRHVKQTPEADTTITFEGYPISAGLLGSTTPTGLQQEFFGGTILDSVEPISLSNTTLTYGVPHSTFSVYVMWTDDSTVSTAKSAIATPGAALRYTFANCFLTSYKTAFTDGMLKVTMKFKCPCRSRTGAGNITVQSTDGSAVMPSIA